MVLARSGADASGLARLDSEFIGGVGQTMLSRLGSLLVLAGLILVLYSDGAYFGWIPGGYTSVPTPDALADGQRRARLNRPQPSLGSDKPQTPVLPSIQPLSVPIAPAPVAVPQGAPVRLVLESIGIDTEVKPGGLKPLQGADWSGRRCPFWESTTNNLARWE